MGLNLVLEFSIDIFYILLDPRPKYSSSARRRHRCVGPRRSCQGPPGGKTPWMLLGGAVFIAAEKGKKRIRAARRAVPI